MFGCQGDNYAWPGVDPTNGVFNQWVLDSANSTSGVKVHLYMKTFPPSQTPCSTVTCGNEALTQAAPSNQDIPTINCSP